MRKTNLFRKKESIPKYYLEHCLKFLVNKDKKAVQEGLNEINTYSTIYGK